MGSKQRDLTGQRFGKLTVVRPNGKGKDGAHFESVVRCDCGNVFSTRDTLLINGKSVLCKQCHFDSLKTHGMTNTRLYTIWQHMKARCENPNNKSYKDYGGRGIRVCEEWHDSKAFINWALANGYREDLTIDRIDVNGDYEPSNCKWSTKLEQGRNKRNTRFIHYKGECMPVWKVAELIGVKSSVIRQRIDKYGMSEKEAVEYGLQK